MGVPKLQIGTITLLGGEYGGKSWPQTLGIEAPRVVWSLPVQDASALLAGPREVTIRMTASDGATKLISRVYVVGEDHSTDKLVRGVILSDVRFYLPFGWVRASYNVTIKSGTGRQTVTDGVVNPNLLPKVANVIFAPYSLKGSDDGVSGVPWNAFEIAKDILERATTGHDFPDIKIRNLARQRTSFIPNNVSVDSSGEAAIGQTLGALGGLDIRVADDGAIEIVNAYLGAERETVDPIVSSYSLERKGVLRFVSMANVAPKSAKVLYTRRVEVRADSWEAQPGPDGNLSTSGDDVTWGTDNTPTMINVAPVTDPFLPFPSAQNPSVQGTLLPMSQLCKAIAALNDQTGAVNGISPSTKLSRQYLLGSGAPGSTVPNGVASPLLSELFELNFVDDRGTGVGPAVYWAQRCRAIRSYFRQVYKLNPVFSRQCIPGSIKAERAGLLDAATATRQPSTLYMDFIQRPAGPGFSKSDKFGWNVNSIPGSPNSQVFPNGIKLYPDGPYNRNPFPLSTATVAPFEVTVVDPTTGVFKFSPVVNPELRHEAKTLPGLVWALPSVSPDKIVREAALAYWEQGKMLLTHRIAMVFSAVPGGPNNVSALHVYKVSVEEALSRLGAPSDAVTPRAPIRELRVRNGVAEARIPWDDDLRQVLLGCFSASDTLSPLDPRLIPVNDESLRDFAVSVFSVYMASVLDHYEGVMQIGFSPRIMPIGSLRQVSHSFDIEGRIYTTLRADGVVPVAAPENMISQSSRNVLFQGIT